LFKSKSLLNFREACVDDKNFLTLDVQHPQIFISYYGNLYSDLESVNDGITMYKCDNINIIENTTTEDICNSFVNFFPNDRTTYDEFCAVYSDPQQRMPILQKIKSIFPFFLALNYKKQWECDDKRSDHSHTISFQEQHFEITYCDKTIFEIHKNFNPSNVVAYIGCNKPYKLQIKDNKLPIDVITVHKRKHVSTNLGELKV
jgi:hypothetical protein